MPSPHDFIFENIVVGPQIRNQPTKTLRNQGFNQANHCGDRIGATAKTQNFSAKASCRKRSVKESIAELAIFDGEPEFRSPLHVGRPNTGSRDELFRRLNVILDRNWLTNDGPMVREFEQRLCEDTNAANCVAVCNATVGLQLLCRALSLTGEVIVPSFTFAASVHALLWQGLTPVFCDVKPGSFHLDDDCLEKLLTSSTSAVLGVHVWGQACDVDAISSFTARHGIHCIFDAAHAIGCEHGGRRIGTFGAAEVFSFHATKCINSFEGGAITTNDDALADQLRLLRNFGFQGNDNVVSVGINGKMSEVNAAMGLTSLEAYDEIVDINRRNAAAYSKGLAQTPGIRLFEPRDRDRNNRQYVVGLVDASRFGLTRDELVSLLTAENVLARRYFFPGCHRMEPYRTMFPEAGRMLPHTEDICRDVLVLPTGSQLTPAAATRICQLIDFASGHASEIRRCLEAQETGAEIQPSD